MVDNIRLRTSCANINLIVLSKHALENLTSRSSKLTPNGNLAKYLSFVQQLEAVLSNSGISPEVKLIYLTQQYKGVTASGMQCYKLLLPAGYEEARRVLIQKFVSPYLINNKAFETVKRGGCQIQDDSKNFSYVGSPVDMRIPTAHKIYRNSNQCFYYDYLKFTSSKSDFFKRKQERHGFQHVENHRKEMFPSFRYVELYHGGLNASVAVFVVPSRFNTRPFIKISDQKECFTYKRYVFLLGLAAGLVSLGSLWLYNLFHWCSGLQTFGHVKKEHETFIPNKLENKKYFSSSCDKDWDFNQRTSTCLRKFECTVEPSVPIDQYFDVHTIRSDCKSPPKCEDKFPQKYIINSHSVITNNPEDHEVQSLYCPQFQWTSASMNCPHYVSGSYKICTICWLNMPNYWLHGPTWDSPISQFDLNQLLGNTSILGLLICLQLIYRAIFLACGNVTKQSCSTQTSLVYAIPNATNNRYTDHSRQLSSASFTSLVNRSITADTLVTTFSSNKTTDPDNHPLSEHDKTEYSHSKSDQFNHISQSELISLCKVNSKKSNMYDNQQQHNSLKSLSASIDSVLFPSIRNEDTSRTKLSDKEFIPITTTTIPTDHIFSKVIKFLDPKQDDWLNNSSVKNSSFLFHRVHSDAVLNKKVNKSCRYLFKGNNYAAQNINSPSLYHRSRFYSSGSSSSSVSCLNIEDNEGFEYDDIISMPIAKGEIISNVNENEMNIEHFNHEDEDGDNGNDGDLDDEGREENILRQLDTLSSLLTTKSDNYFQGQSCDILSDLNTSMNNPNTTSTDDGTLMSSSPVINGSFNNFSRSNDSDAMKFTDLTQKTVVLTDELNKLGITLDRLLYKLQANQIQLDQAEDNLDYMWYLRDNLNNDFSSGTSDCCSAFGVSDVEAEALINGSSNTDLDDDDDDVDDKDNDYWLSHGRMTQSSVHPDNSYPVHDISGYLSSSSHGTLDHSFYSTLKLSNEHFDYHPSSNLDSGLEQSVVTCSESYSGLEQSVVTCSESCAHIFCSMPEKHLKNTLGYHSSYNRYLSNSHIFKNYTQSLSKYSRFRKRYNHHFRRKVFSSESTRFSTSILPDSDGFVHPDFTFENDGQLNWSEPMKVNPS
ncbi:hypothetical protein MN116_005101 [Schistosoma mekongi]|uniref:Uncharacterized protein n=1 Tax=Schistosoma mekongi TaxID=38744 RepID=A0AAE1ZE76_SCHME|nr:hypothetical protein MN116_005101 [Schistosoma mekongi]